MYPGNARNLHDPFAGGSSEGLTLEAQRRDRKRISRLTTTGTQNQLHESDMGGTVSLAIYFPLTIGGMVLVIM